MADWLREEIEKSLARRGTRRSNAACSARSTRAAAVFSMAYTARCEHSLDPDEEIWTTTRPRLRADADALLS